MIFFANAVGSITKIITEPVYQGSINTGRVVLVAPFPLSVQVTVAFTLPNGMNTQINLATPNMSGEDLNGRLLTPNGEHYNAWAYTLKQEITAYSGQVTVQFFIYDSAGNVLTTYASEFDIAPGVAPQLPITPDATIYEEILESLAALNARIDNITGEESETSATFVNIVTELPVKPTNKDAIYILELGNNIPTLYVYNKNTNLWIRLDSAIINVTSLIDAIVPGKFYNVPNDGIYANINGDLVKIATAQQVEYAVNTANSARSIAESSFSTAREANTTANQANTTAQEALNKVNSVNGRLVPKGSVESINTLPTPSAATLGYLYNVNSAFTTNNNFVEGAGKNYPANENVAIVEPTPGVYKYDVFSGLVDLSKYQEKLVSGKNIKTVNGQSLLGSGNLDIQGIKLLTIEWNSGAGGTLTQDTYNEIVNGFANTIVTINDFPNNLFKPLLQDSNGRYIYVFAQNVRNGNTTRTALLYIGISSDLSWETIGEEELRSVYAQDNSNGTVNVNVGGTSFNLVKDLKTVNNQSLIGSGNISIPKGETGAQGPIGPQGVGIKNITTGTVSQANGYTLTQIIFEKDNDLRDSINVQAKNGENGLPGADGTIVEANPNETPTKALEKIKIDNVVYSLDSGGEGSPTIIDVAELPSENIDPNVIYRVPSCVYYIGLFPAADNRYIAGNFGGVWFKCVAVDGLPEVGNPCATFFEDGTPESAYTYYNIQDGENWAYVDETLSSIFGAPVGWYPASTLFELANVTYDGIVYNLDNIPDDNGIVRVFVQHTLYSYKDKWAQLNDYIIYLGGSVGVIPTVFIKKLSENPEQILVKIHNEELGSCVARYVSKYDPYKGTAAEGVLQFYTFEVKKLDESSFETGNITLEQAGVLFTFDKYYEGSSYMISIVPNTSGGNFVLNLSGENGILTDEEYQAFVNNFPNVLIVYNLGGNNSLVLSQVVVTDNMYHVFMQAETDILGVVINPDKSWEYMTIDLVKQYESNLVSKQGDNTLSGTNTFNGSTRFNNTVDFTNATVTGLPISGGGSGGAGLSYKEIKLTNMTNSAGTVSSFGGGISIRLWLPDSIVITDFSSLVSALRILCNGDYSGRAQYRCINAQGAIGTGTALTVIAYIGTSLSGNLNLITANHAIADSLLNATVTVTTLMTASSGSGSSSGGGKTKITVSELYAMFQNYASNLGKIIQFVYKGTDYAINECVTAIGLIQISNDAYFYKSLIGSMSGGSSSLYYSKYYIEINGNNSDGYFMYTSYDWDTASTASTDEEYIETITDDTFDIYVIG